MHGENQRYIVGSYLVAVALLFVTIDRMASTALGWFDVANGIPDAPDFVRWSRILAFVISAAALTVLVRSEQANTFMDEVFAELRKVTWPLPLKKNTWLPTLVVIVFVIICAVILGMFDWLWGSIIHIIFR